MNNILNSLEILPIQTQNQNNNVQYNPVLPDINNGSILMLVAPPKSGKSVNICSMILRKSFYKDKFDTIYIFSTTISNGDNSTRFLLEYDRVKIYNKYSDEALQNILNFQASFDKKNMPRISIIFDDFLSFPNIKKTSLMFTLASMYRHYGVKFLVYSTQIFRGVPPIVRQSLDYLIMYSNGNQKEVLKIYDEVGSRFGSFRQFIKLLNQATKDKYNFLYLDLYHRPALAYKNFTQLIYEAPQTFEYLEPN